MTLKKKKKKKNLNDPKFKIQKNSMIPDVRCKKSVLRINLSVTIL